MWYDSEGKRTHLSTEKTRAIFPMARILFLMTSFLTAGVPPETQGELKTSGHHRHLHLPDEGSERSVSQMGVRVPLGVLRGTTGGT